VKDTGIGIPPDAINKIFKENCIIDEHKEMNPSGNGIGLEICKRICVQLGGDITVESELYVGTRFIIRVPCKFSDQI
jgi:signal transduction histidine kinase